MKGEAMNQAVLTDVTMLEIFGTHEQLGAAKALGSDGSNGLFYHN